MSFSLLLIFQLINVDKNVVLEHFEDFGNLILNILKVKLVIYYHVDSFNRKIAQSF